jgi:hypothetical protein
VQVLYQPIKEITLGNPKVGITLANWTFKIPDKFKVVRDQDGSVCLINSKYRFTLYRQRPPDAYKDYIFIKIFDRDFIFEPFLNIAFLRKLLGVS